MPRPTSKQIKDAIKIMDKDVIGAHNNGVAGKATVDKIYDDFFKDDGPFAKVTEGYKVQAFNRLMIYYINNGTSEEKPPEHAEIRFSIDKDTTKDKRHKAKPNDFKVIINKHKCTIREFMRPFALDAINLLKEKPEWSSGLSTKWAVPIDRYYLAIDFADRLTVKEQQELNLDNRDLTIINNLTFANTQRKAVSSMDKTSNQTIFNPGNVQRAWTSNPSQMIGWKSS